MKMKLLCVGIVLLGVSCFAGADTFGTEANQFTIDFVPISGSRNPTSGYGIVNNDYCIGKFEITNDQWTKFVNIHGKPRGNPSTAYDREAYWTGGNRPTNCVSWYEAAQFVNWLNTSTGHQKAYNFTGTQGTNSYTFDIWDSSEAWGGTNLYRHKDAYYFLPTEDEWVKAAYWNGSTLQTWAMLNDACPVKGVDSNYGGSGGPWNVGSGSEELNGTFDMMGNVFEWIEDSWWSPERYPASSSHIYRGGSNAIYGGAIEGLMSSTRYDGSADSEVSNIGFRVASVPEPASLGLLFLGGLLIRRKLYLEKMHVRGR